MIYRLAIYICYGNYLSQNKLFLIFTNMTLDKIVEVQNPLFLHRILNDVKRYSICFNLG
jgi:hypothetical protein